jgi:hypothetical protein
MQGLHDNPYQEYLRAIGRYIDCQVYRHILLIQTDHGFILRVCLNKHGTIQAIGVDLTVIDLLNLINGYQAARGQSASAIATPLFPTGYEDFLRALGFELDQALATNIQLVELSEGLLVSYNIIGEAGQTTHREVLFDADLIEHTLRNGYLRRRSPVPSEPQP